MPGATSSFLLLLAPLIFQKQLRLWSAGFLRTKPRARAHAGKPLPPLSQAEALQGRLRGIALEEQQLNEEPVTKTEVSCKSCKREREGGGGEQLFHVFSEACQLEGSAQAREGIQSSAESSTSTTGTCFSESSVAVETKGHRSGP